MELPRFVGLKSTTNGKYLRYIHEDVPLHGFLQVTGGELVTPFTKFEVVKAKCGDGLVNMRSCYNNKFWLRASPVFNWIVVAADEPEEDQSKWSCTLFKPVIHYVHGDVKTVSFHHVQLDHSTFFETDDPSHDGCLFAGPTKSGVVDCDFYTVIDWDTMFVLPRHIAFKGDNENYLRREKIMESEYLLFDSKDLGDALIENEIIINPDGNIKIKSSFLIGGGFWKRNSDDWILANSGFPIQPFVPGPVLPSLPIHKPHIPDDLPIPYGPGPVLIFPNDSLFWPEKVGKNIVALRNLGNDQYCKRYTDNDFTSGLSASDPSISEYSRLEVEELVTSRTIETLVFSLSDGRIYDQVDIIFATQEFLNEADEPITVDVKFSYADIKSRSWNSSVSSKLHALVNLKAENPFVVHGKIAVPNEEFTGLYQWGEIETSKTQVETTYNVTVPPKCKVKVSLIATKASCDIPFSYSQQDILENGHHETHEMNDGIYTGINYFGFDYKVEEEKL